jgi:uncharacterized membrane protein YhaH (DUF805 family)
MAKREAKMRQRLNDAWRSVVDTTTGVIRFNGRSRIVDVVYFWIATTLVQVIALVLIDPLDWDTHWWAEAAIRMLGILPAFALFCRRLHDQGLSGWFALIVLPLLAVNLYQFYRATFAVLNPLWLAAPSPIQGFVPWMMGMALIVLILLLRPGQNGANRYGPDPREAAQPSNARVAASTSS